MTTRPSPLRCLILCAIALCAPAVHAAPPDEEATWQRIEVLERGPQRQPEDGNDARALAREHLALQKRALTEFIATYPTHSRIPEARLRLAAVLATEGMMDSRQSPVDEAMRLLQAIERDPATPTPIKTNAAFRFASLYLQSMKGREVEMRESIVRAARSFAAKYPNDSRAAPLLAEVASVCDAVPSLKQKLLEEARSLSRNESLNRRIDDDLLRLSLLQKTVPFEIPTIDGRKFRLADQRGKIVAVVFWSSESPHCLLWMRDLRRRLDSCAGSDFAVATVALDTDSARIGQALKEFRLAGIPTHFDGKGWETPVARTLGINALPTIFLFDREGRLRSLNSAQSLERDVQRLRTAR